MTRDNPHCLVMQLFGPMQSWGISSRWSERDTLLEPSKSGVIGILAAAQGRRRNESVDDLAALKMGVRVDLEGVPSVDFQTAGGGDTSAGIAKAADKAPSLKDEWARLDGAKKIVRQGSSISNRYHLQDAAFLVALEGDDVGLLSELDAALRSPVYPIGLGRRGYVPSIPVAMPRDLGVMEGCISQVFQSVTWLPEQEHLQVRNLFGRRQPRLRTVIETSGPSHATRMDQPIGAAFATRQFGPRGVVFSEVDVRHPDKKEPTDDHS